MADILGFMNKISNKIKIETIMEDARKSGATELEIVSTKNIIIDDNLAKMCEEPRCENYGLSKSCPPHVAGPSILRKQMEKFKKAIFFKIDIPSEILYSSERQGFFQLLHEIAASIENDAVKMGFTNARAFAGGSCKNIFCYDFPECLALSKKGHGQCRNPDSARPSMSGYGINVQELIKTAGFEVDGSLFDNNPLEIKMANIYGLVLID